MSIDREAKQVMEAILDMIVANGRQEPLIFFEERGAISWGFTDDLMRLYGVPACGKFAAQALNELIKEGVIKVEFVTKAEGAPDSDLGIKMSVVESVARQIRINLKLRSAKKYMELFRNILDGKDGRKLITNLLIPPVTSGFVSIESLLIYAESGLQEARGMGLDVSKFEKELPKLKIRARKIALENSIEELAGLVGKTHDGDDLSLLVGLFVNDVKHAIKEAKKVGLDTSSFETRFQEIKGIVEKKFPDFHGSKQ